METIKEGKTIFRAGDPRWRPALMQAHSSIFEYVPKPSRPAPPPGGVRSDAARGATKIRI